MVVENGGLTSKNDGYYMYTYLSIFLSFYVYISKTSFNNQKQCKIDPFGIKAAKMGGLIQELGLKFGPNLMMYDDISHHGDEDWHGDDIDERRSLAAASCSSTSFAATGAYVIHHVSSCIYYHCRVLTWGKIKQGLYIYTGWCFEPSWKMVEFVNFVRMTSHMKWKIKAMFETTIRSFFFARAESSKHHFWSQNHRLQAAVGLVRIPASPFHLRGIPGWWWDEHHKIHEKRETFSIKSHKKDRTLIMMVGNFGCLPCLLPHI